MIGMESQRMSLERGCMYGSRVQIQWVVNGYHVFRAHLANVQAKDSLQFYAIPWKIQV